MPIIFVEKKLKKYNIYGTETVGGNARSKKVASRECCGCLFEWINWSDVVSVVLLFQICNQSLHLKNDFEQNTIYYFL